MPSSRSSLSADELEDLQAFLKDWLRHAGRTQADLRRALRAASIRMPVLLAELQQIHAQQGLAGLAERLCGIEALWQGEDNGAVSGREGPASPFEDSLGQLDLLLEEIRLEQQG
jgi:hypothetical protein